MKKLTLLLAVVLSGCGSLKVVEVSKPIPYCPAPPIVPACENYVDKLTPADIKDPGKVAQAYKLDMTCYRANDATYRMIMDAYITTSAQADEVRKQLDAASATYSKVLTDNGIKVGEPQKP